MSNLRRHSFSSNKPHHITYIEGHRGVNRLEPENTLNSFSKSINLHLDSIELDVWLTKDKIPVIIHGGDKGEINLTTDGKGLIKEINFEDLKKIHTLKGNLNVPTLEEVLQLCKDKTFVNIELKDPEIHLTFEKVMALVEKYDMINQIEISSFKHAYYEEVKKYPKKIEFGFLYEDHLDKNFVPYNFDVENCSMNINIKDVNEEIIRKAHEKGNALMCWCELKMQEDENLYEKVFNLGIGKISIYNFILDVLCCNEPEKALLSRNKYFRLD